MRLGVSGKGGTGKTTVAAGLARGLGRSGRPVLGIDCDSDPNLALGVGISEADAAATRPLLDQSGAERVLPPEDLSVSALVDGYGTRGPDNVTVLLGAQAERAGSG